MNGVLLDTSFLISLSDPGRANHGVADRYFREFKKQRIPMYLSAIVASEFQVRQPVTDLPLRSLIVLPFNIDHAMRCGELTALGARDSGDDRVRVKDDLKLIAQCAHEGISHIISEDEGTLAKYVVRLATALPEPLHPIILRRGFDDSAFPG